MNFFHLLMFQPRQINCIVCICIWIWMALTQIHLLYSLPHLDASIWSDLEHLQFGCVKLEQCKGVEGRIR